MDSLIWYFSKDMFKNHKLLFAVIGSLICLGLAQNRVHAVPVAAGLEKPSRATCYVNQKALDARLAALKAAPSIYGAAAIATTTYKIIVLRVDFSDQNMSTTKLQAEALFEKFRGFYAENSYGYLNLVVTVSDGGSGSNGAFRLPRPLSFYAGGISSDYKQLVNDALAAASTVNFSLYDQVILYHAGIGAESSSNSSSAIWSVYLPSDFAFAAPSINGKTFNGIEIVPESEDSGIDPLGVLCHEYGHQLGLPDLYNTSTGKTQLGSWSLMDYGTYAGSPLGSNPAHLDAWSKLFLGFSNPQTVSSITSGALAAASKERRAFYRVPISVSAVGSSNEYFLLEYRRSSGADYDKGIAGDGLLIWHIDDSIASNSTRLSNNTVNNGTPNLGVDLIEANEVSSSNGASAGNAWTSNQFSGDRAQAFNGNSSGVEVREIAGAGTTQMTLRIANVFDNPAVNANTSTGDSSVVVVGGSKGYINPSLSETVSIAFKPTASGNVKIQVFTTAGDLVYDKTFSGTANQQGLAVWDGKNSDGSTVSSGIYVVYVSGLGIDVQKKVAVIR